MTMTKETVFAIVLLCLASALYLGSQRHKGGTPAPRGAAPSLYSRADVSRHIEQQDLAGKVAAGLNMLADETYLCRKQMNLNTIKISGSSTAASGYLFQVDCGYGSAARTIFFTQKHIVQQ